MDESQMICDVFFTHVPNHVRSISLATVTYGIREFESELILTRYRGQYELSFISSDDDYDDIVEQVKMSSVLNNFFPHKGRCIESIYGKTRFT
ncbi:hypothetical protein LCGC14_1048050, partial [marine sediment metagenome]